jgi:hypothetical protein
MEPQVTEKAPEAETPILEVTGENTAREAEPTDAPVEEPAKEPATQPVDDVATLKQRLASAEDEADRAKRFIVNFVSDRQAKDTSGPAEDPIGAVPPGDFIESFKEDPIGLLDKHFATRMAPIVADNLEARAKDNRTRARERLGAEVWETYGEDIDRFMEGMSLHTRANPGSYEEALNFVRAKNIDKEIERGVARRLAEMNQESRSAVEGGGSHSGAPARGNGRGPVMTDEERQIAKGFGMTEKEWMKYKSPKGAR